MFTTTKTLSTIYVFSFILLILLSFSIKANGESPNQPDDSVFIIVNDDGYGPVSKWAAQWYGKKIKKKYQKGTLAHFREVDREYIESQMDENILEEYKSTMTSVYEDGTDDDPDENPKIKINALYSTEYSKTAERLREEEIKRVAGLLTKALKKTDNLDVFILGHSNSIYKILDYVPEKLKLKLRLVYNTGCTDSSQGEKWFLNGASAYVGHIGASCSPTFTFSFIDYWSRGLPLNEAVKLANQENASTLRNPILGELFCKMFLREKNIKAKLSKKQNEELDTENLVRGSRAAIFGNNLLSGSLGSPKTVICKVFFSISIAMS